MSYEGRLSRCLSGYLIIAPFYSNPDTVSKIVTSLSVKMHPRDLKTKDHRQLCTMIMSQWLPLATATFQTVVEIIPPPPVSQSIRLPHMLHPSSYQSHSEPTTRVERALYSCDASPEAPIVVYVSKMFAVKSTDLPELRKVEITADEMRERGRIERARRERERALELQLDKESLIGLGADGKGPGEADIPEAEAPANGAVVGARPLPLSTGIPLSNGIPIPPAPLAPADTPDVKPTIIDLSGPIIKAAPKKGETTLESETVLGFARLYSGTLSKDTPLQVLLPKYNDQIPPTHPHNLKHTTQVKVSHLYMMMGRDLIEVDTVPAGNVFAINGLEGKVMRNATMYAPTSQGSVEGDLLKTQEDGWVNLAGIIMTVSTFPLFSLEISQLTLEATPFHRLRLLFESPLSLPYLRSFPSSSRVFDSSTRPTRA